MQNNTFTQNAQNDTTTNFDCDAFVPRSPLFVKSFDRRISVDTFMLENEKEENNFENRNTPEPSESPSKQQSAFGLFCQSFAHNNQGEFIRKFEQKEIYLFLCHLGHKFMLTKKQILADYWCNNCTKTLNNIKRFATENKGQILSSNLSKVIRVQCEKGHIWETGYKKACLKWCKECSKTSKRLLKEMINNENKKIEDEKRIHQVS
jgi:hypothetical protein